MFDPKRIVIEDVIAPETQQLQAAGYSITKKGGRGVLVKDGGVAALNTNFQGLAVGKNPGAGRAQKGAATKTRVIKDRFVQVSLAGGGPPHV